MVKKNMNVTISFRVNGAERIPDNPLYQALFALGVENCAASITITDADTSAVLYTESQSEDLTPWKLM